LIKQYSDYIRYPGRDKCYCHGCRERFEADTACKVENWPEDCYAGTLQDKYAQWRCDQITRLVKAVHEQAKSLKPELKISAAVFGAYPETPSDIRQFAMARIRTAELTGETFDMPAGFDPERLLAGAFSRFAGGRPVAIRLLFDREIADWVREREWHPGQTLKTRRNGDVELAFKAAGLYEVSRWILGWGRYARVLAPPALKKMVADEIRAMAKRAR